MPGRAAVRRARRSLGLLGQLLAILLLTVTVEFAASTLLYERSARALVRDDEAQRLAEHLVVARALVQGQPLPERPTMARRTSTQRYAISWAGNAAPPADTTPAMAAMRGRVIDWEPSLSGSDLTLRLVGVGREPALLGGLRLDDGTWLRFRAAAPSGGASITNRILLAVLPAALVLLLGAVLFRRALRPIAALSHATERVGAERDVPLAEAGPPEVRHLVRSFNAMQARIRELIADRTQALAAVAHDLRTPLARLGLRIDAVEARQDAAAMRGDVAEMEAMVASLLAFLGGENDPETPLLADVGVLVQTIVDDAADRGGDARYDGPDHLDVRVRVTGLRRAVANLVENALHYGERAAVSLAVEGDRIVIRVDDDGPGIPRDRLDDALRPFTRLDPARGRNTRGLGLGLTIVARAATLEGGAIRLVNRTEGGLRAELALPRRS
ncbi:ATP-binding protein [Sphingomonas sp.]|uniref:ATP-binding protein n=1 Tax=Sphingomonas sp. TaxID=28214 RepID=UPI003B00B3FE